MKKPSRTKPIQKVLEELKGVKRNGDGYQAHCPAHKDLNPSLSISESRDNRVLMHCHAGCKTDEVLDALGLGMKDLYPDRSKSGKTIYHYDDADGNHLFDIVRHGSKQFYVRHKVDDGHVKGLGGITPVLYNLPAVRDAINEGKPIFVTEGEKDAESLIKKFGLVATTSPFGAGKWRNEYADYLIGANVYIFYDNDNAGRKHANQVATSLFGKAKSIRIVDLPNQNEGEDITDWTERGGTKKRLKEICTQTPLLEHHQEPEQTQAHEIALLEKFAFYNKKYATVMAKGKYMVIEPDAFDPSLNTRTLEFISPQALEKKYSCDKIITKYRDDKPVYENSFTAWLESPQRRDYERLVFDPGEYHGPDFFNIWRGFSCKPKPHRIDSYLNHVFEIIAGADNKVYEYIIAFMADTVQLRPRPGVAIGIIGSQGAGKGVFAKNFGSLFGPHFIHITQVAHLTGRFNKHLATSMVVFVDEALWAGKKDAEGVLKALITEETMMIEPKNIDPYPVKNHCRLIFSSNSDWIVPAGLDDRRFFIVRAADKYKQDREYFSRIQRQMDNGGREGLLRYLLDYDLENIDITDFPRTAELANQKLMTMDLPQKFWYSVLQDGRLFSSTIGNDGRRRRKAWGDGRIETQVLYACFLEFINGQPLKWFSGDVGFGIALSKLVPNLSKKPFNKVSNYCLPTLDACRHHFDKLTKQNWDWPKKA